MLVLLSAVRVDFVISVPRAVDYRSAAFEIQYVSAPKTETQKLA